MTSETPRVLLFDIDGTILDPAGEGPRCLRKALEDVFGQAGEIESYNMAGKTDWQIVTDLMLGAGFSQAEVTAKRTAAFMAYARQVELALPTLKMRILPGVAALLTRLAESPDFELGLVTGNVRETVPHKLISVGIEPSIFRFGAFGSENPDRNLLPDLAISRLEKMIERAVPRDKVLVIGDTPRDIECARYAGVKVLCVATGGYGNDELGAFEPDYLLDDLTDTGAVLSILREF